MERWFEADRFCEGLKPAGSARQGRKTAMCRLLSADAFFERIRVLEPRELDGEAVFEMADDPARHPADGDERADFRPLTDKDLEDAS